MIETIPYTYLIKFIPTGQVYYGVRTKVGCSPNDLWVEYFTSSKIVKRLLVEYGIESFNYEIRQIFSDIKSARKWENKLLTRIDAAKNPIWLNKHNGGELFYNTGHSEETRLKLSIAGSGEKHRQFGIPRTDEQKRKTSEANTGERHHQFGKPISVECKQKISDALKGRVFSQESKLKMSVANEGSNNSMFGLFGENNPNFGSKRTEEQKNNISLSKSMWYSVVFPDGRVEIVKSLIKFCDAHGLCISSMGKVARGKQKKPHKGYICNYYTEEQALK